MKETIEKQIFLENIQKIYEDYFSRFYGINVFVFFCFYIEINNRDRSMKGIEKKCGITIMRKVYFSIIGWFFLSFYTKGNI